MNKKHGHVSRTLKKGRWVQTKSPTYNSWEAMNRRCYDEGHRWYHIYGGRGVDVCERWRRGTPNAFRNFLEDMGERPARNMTLDRKDANLGYYKNNCQWAGKDVQRANQRTSFQHFDVEPINAIPY